MLFSSTTPNPEASHVPHAVREVGCSEWPLEWRRRRSLLKRHTLIPPQVRIITAEHRARWETRHLSLSERLQAGHDLATLDPLQAQWTEIDAELARPSTSPPWADPVPYRTQLPGFDLIVTLTVPEKAFEACASVVVGDIIHKHQS